MIPNTLVKNKIVLGKYVKTDIFNLDFIEGIEYITTLYIKKELQENSKVINYFITNSFKSTDEKDIKNHLFN